LAGVLRALQGEDSGRRYAVLDEELSLEFCLWEIFKKNAWCKLLRHLFDECHSDRFVIFSIKLVITNEVIEVDQFHVGPLTESITKSGFSRSLWANDA
jgi:hypothetical protein